MPSRAIRLVNSLEPQFSWDHLTALMIGTEMVPEMWFLIN
jgi:hypothetical protein